MKVHFWKIKFIALSALISIFFCITELQATRFISWESRIEDRLSSCNVKRLFHNEIAAIRVPSFIKKEDCARFILAANEAGFDYYKDVLPPIGRIGITQFEHTNDKQGYFSKVSDAQAKHFAIIQKSKVDIVHKVLKCIGKSTHQDVEIASEPNNRPYYAGLIRHINSAYLHFDFAKYDAPGWSIDRHMAQIAWNVYLSVPEKGGECIVYNKLWQPQEFEGFHLPEHTGSYGYSKEIVTDTSYINITPSQGELVLFNTRNFHEVLEAAPGNNRVSVSSFLGLLPDNNIKAWS